MEVNDQLREEVGTARCRGTAPGIAPATEAFTAAESMVTDTNVIRIMCPNLACQRILAVPAHARGKLVRCRSCQITIRIPDPKSRPEPAPAPSPPEEAEA